MDTELNILKQISVNKGKASVQSIAKGLEMENDYIRYLCTELIKKGLVKGLKRRDWYKITQKGQKKIGEIEKSITKYPTRKRTPLKKRVKKKITKRIKKRASRGSKKKIRRKPKSRKRKKPEKKTKKIRRKIKKRGDKKKSGGKEITSIEEIMPPEKKFKNILKILKDLFYIKKG